MEGFSVRFCRQMSKIENSLAELNKEILITNANLEQLRKHSAEMVRKLNGVSSPSAYLNKFVEVNLFLLKYLGFLMEINCKFEILPVSEDTCCRTTGIRNDEMIKALPEDCNKLNSYIILNEPLKNLVPIEACKVTEMVACEQPLSKSNVSVQNSIEMPVGGMFKNKYTMTNSGCTDESNLFLDSDADVEQKLKMNGEQVAEVLPPSKINSDQVEEWLQKLKLPTPLKVGREKERFHKSNESIENESNISNNAANEVAFHKSTLQNVLPSIKGTSPANSSKGSKRNKMNKHGSGNIKDLDNISTNNKGNEDQSDKSEENSDDQCEIEPLRISRKPGEEFEVVIEHIKSPSEFYVHFIDRSFELKALKEKLKVIPHQVNFDCKKKEVMKVFPIGKSALYYSPCLETWFRVKILDWCLQFRDDYVRVFLLDYGETKCVTISSLHPIPENLKKYPSLVQRCHLYGILPVDTNKDQNTLCWGQELREEMRELTDAAFKIKIRVAPSDPHHPSESLPVMLCAEGNNARKCINDSLVKAKYAIYDKTAKGFNLGGETRKTPSVSSELTDDTALENWNPMKEDFKSYQNCYDLDINDPSAVIYNYVSKDYDRICGQFAKTGKCFKGDSCRKEHNRLDPLGFTSDKEEIYQTAFNTLTKPQPESVFEVQVTCIKRVNEFYCILENSKDSPDEESLQSLNQYVNNKENVRDMKKLVIPPSTGQIVLALFSEDMSWYRGKILESQPEKDVYAVLFVDYGNKEWLPLSRIRAIEPKYLHLPFQAIQCCIFGIQPNPAISPEKEREYLQKKMVGQRTSVQVVSVFPGDRVCLLVHAFDQDGVNLGSEMVAKGYALYKPEMIVSHESETVPG